MERTGESNSTWYVNSHNNRNFSESRLYVCTIRTVSPLTSEEVWGWNGLQEVPTYESSSWELSKMQMCVPSKPGMSEMPSISYSWRSFSSTISHLLSLLESVTLPSCPLNASPCMEAVILYYCTSRYCTVRLKMFYFLCLLFFTYYLYRNYYYSVTQLCPTLCDPMDCNLPGSSVHGILQAKILEWIAISSPRGSSLPRDRICISYISCVCRWILYH